jgi:hypothetical protein
MSSIAAVARQQKTANFYQLCNLSGKTKITYYPFADTIGDDNFSAASLKYEGPEGTWTFHASEITHEETSLGQLISVELRANAVGPSKFWFFLPPVVLGDRDFQSFTTYGVKNGGSVQRPNNQIDYEVERFFGDAKAIPLGL